MVNSLHFNPAKHLSENDRLMWDGLVRNLYVRMRSGRTPKLVNKKRIKPEITMQGAATGIVTKTKQGT